MGFNIGSLFNRRETEPVSSKSFDRFKGYNNKELDQALRKGLNKLDRHKVEAVMDGKIKVGRTLSVDRILREVGSEHGYEFKKKIQDKVFTTHSDDQAEAERLRQHHILRAKMDRLRDEDPSRAREYHSATPSKLEHRNTFYQPGSSTPVDQVSDDHPSVANKAG